MLTIALTYDAPTATLTVLDTGTAAPAYRLLRRRVGRADTVLPTTVPTATLTDGFAPGAAWVVPGDGCPLLVLESGTLAYPTTGPPVFTTTDASAPVAFLAEAQHTEALARCYAVMTRFYDKATTLDDALAVLVRRSEARACLAENNPDAAHRLLTTTVFPT